MEHWRLAYLGVRHVPRELSEFELNTFFTFSRSELARIDSRRTDLYRLSIALHVGFLRMTGRPLDSYKHIPTVLWRHLGQQLGVLPPEVGTLRSLYDGNFKTLSDHQSFARTVINFRVLAEHQRRYVIRWLKEQLTGRPERGQLMNDLKRWFYEHRIVIPPDRTLRQFVVQAVHDIEDSLREMLERAFGADRLASWARLLGQPHKEHTSLQRWLWAVPLRNSTHQMSEVLDKINLLTMHGVADSWPAECNDAIVRHYARRCASRPSSISKRIEPQGRRLEAACFMRYALCTATDHVLTMLRRWVLKVVHDASREVDAARVAAADQLYQFALAVKALANDESLSREGLGKELCVLADQVLHPQAPNRRSQIRQCLLRKPSRPQSADARSPIAIRDRRHPSGARCDRPAARPLPASRLSPARRREHPTWPCRARGD
jgi:hypothetical protein